MDKEAGSKYAGIIERPRLNPGNDKQWDIVGNMAGAIMAELSLDPKNEVHVRAAWRAALAAWRVVRSNP
jgi:hypothetical protein